MLRPVLLLVLLLATLQSAFAQKQITTFILVRHAEKGNDGTSDPDLKPEGDERANRLAAMLGKTTVDAIYSTNYKRTKNTVGPLAKSKGLEVNFYEAFKGDEIEAMLKKHEGKTVVISGHSNNIPWIANFLLGKEQFKDYEDSDYNNLLVVSVVQKGKVASVTWLTF